MDRLIVFLYVIFFTLGANGLKAQGINFSEGSWEEIVALAKQSEKGIFVDVYTDWCGPCKKLSKLSFPDSEVGVIYNQHFISLKVNAEKGRGINLARGLNVLAFPTMLYFDRHGVLLLTTRGFKTPYALIEIAKLVSSLESDKALVSMLDKSSADLNKTDLHYLLNNTTQFYNKEKPTYYNRLYGLMSLEEKQDPVTSKLFLSNYNLLQDEGLRTEVINNYQVPESFSGKNNDHIRIQHNLHNALIVEEQLARKEKDLLGFRRRVDRKLQFLLKTNKLSPQDTLMAQREADLNFYDYHSESMAFWAAAKTLIEEMYLPIILKNDLRAHSGRQSTLLKTQMTIKKLMGHVLNDPAVLRDIIGWADILLDKTEVYNAYLIKARAYYAMDDLSNTKATITQGLAAPIGKDLRKDLNSLLRRAK